MKLSQMSRGEEGNTRPLRERGRRYILVLNNYSLKEKSDLENKLSQMSQYFVVGEEVGESGTPHLQGYVEFKNQVDFSVLKKINGRIHWEKAIATRGKNYVYCTKEKKFVEYKKPSREEELKLRFLKERYENVVWKNWQADVLKIIEGSVHDRKIYWFWEPTGNVGKTYVCNYICAKYDVIICDGKKDNIFNQVKVMLIDQEKDPKAVIIDIPRDGHVIYSVLEQLKNGVIYSGKYEGGQLFLPRLHVVVFSNELPDMDTMSKDRWVINKIVQ